ncbi:MAG: chorismate synthase [Pyramidobacter sp.]|nr:chorismate synthase [Pyramidobacter sp.]
MSSSWGTHIRFSVFGQSHSAGIGAVVEGLPAGFQLDTDRLSDFMKRRAPGGALATPRREADSIEFLSGLANGRLCGAPLCMVIRNTNVRPGDYSEFQDTPRPGHADFTSAVKYGGYQDPSGGGHFSGRLTAPIAAVGGICMQILESMGIFIGAHILRIGDVCDRPFDPVSCGKDDFERRVFSPLTVLDPDAGERMARVIEEARSAQDSVGGVIECAACGLPAGIGDPMFDGLESRIASLMFGVPAVKGVEFGSGFSAASMLGSQHNDPFICSHGRVATLTNNAGGILGGISTGMPLVFRAAFKPTSSIAKAQTTLSLKTHAPAQLNIKGRHDPCIAVRAVPVTEAVLAAALCDALLPGNYEPLKGAE